MAQNYNDWQREGNSFEQNWQREDPYASFEGSQQPYRRNGNSQQSYQRGENSQQSYQQGGNSQQSYRQNSNSQQPYYHFDSSQQPNRQNSAPQQSYYRNSTPQQPYYQNSNTQQSYYPGGNPNQPYQPSHLRGSSRQTYGSSDGGRGSYPPRDDDPYTAYVTPPGGPRRGHGRKSNAPLIIILVVLGIGILIAGGKLASIFLNYQKDRSAYSSLAEDAVSTIVPVSYRDAPEEETETMQETEIPIEVDWDYLKSVNPNVVGWLYCPDTVINYPVVQTRDHEFYLKHGFDDSSNTAGTLFADMNSVLGVTQSHYIIYGHNMKDNSMFGSVANYVDESYYEEHPTLYYLTPTQCYRIDLFCARYVEADTDNYTTYFSSTEDYQAYLNKMSTDCFWLNTAVMNTDYQLFSMSTCVYPSGYVNPRLLVQGVMVPIE